MAKAKTIEETYQKKDLHEHVLLRPDTYIGSIKNVTEAQWVAKEGKIVSEVIEYNPGLLKIFDEILVNAIDHSVRDQTVKTLKVNFDKKAGSISVMNDGKGITVALHKEYNIYVPELIFGNLLSGTNFDDNVERVVGGKNGLGSKVSSIFSKEFILETVDSDTGLYYKQIFSENMYKKSEPEIKKSKVKSYTKITFTPDFKRFKLKGLTTDMISLMEKRVYDCIACTNANVSVYLNDVKLKGKEFKQYTNLYSEASFVHERIEQGKFVWDIAVCLNENFHQVSFVNGIATTQGGKHVDYILNQIVKRVTTFLEEKKKLKNVKPSYIKDKLFLFVRSTIVNPGFNSQSKEYLTTPAKDFGIKFELSDKFIEKLCKSGLVEDLIALTKFKTEQELSKKTAGSPRKVRLNIPNLDDAHNAGTNKSKDCTLILTEGLSAKSFAVSGFSVVGRDNYGAFPLKGVTLNVRNATHSQLLNNEEVNNIIKILGLTRGVKYKTTENLRYGRILILTDQDLDGSHIKGLLINLFHYYWRDLLSVKGFITTMKTPIIKISKGKNKQVKEFFTIRDYEIWKENNSLASWNVKYYKGLGTSNALEAKDIFKRMDENLIKYTDDLSEETDKNILLAFDKEQADNRKIWLQQYNSDMILDQADKDLEYSDFVNKDLIHFSMYDGIRSIPSICDGLKPSQRKVIYTMFKKRYTKEIKVAQLGAAAAEATSYHHGEASMFSTIIGMAQDYVGSNNINLLMPNGSFGTRSNSKDAASPRYIFTELNPVTEILFNSTDFKILKYLRDDDQMIEPEFYIPLLPMVLVNGTVGVGTGYSTNIPCFNPRDIIDNIKKILEDKEILPLTPWYRGFKGEIKRVSDYTFEMTGKYNVISDKVLEITELPVGTWTDDYLNFINGIVDKGEYGITNSKNYSTESDVKIQIIFGTKQNLKEFLDSDVLKNLKLKKNINTTNMHLFDEKGSIKKYNSPEDILYEFVGIRIKYNRKRREFLINEYTSELEILKNKIRFLEDVISHKIIFPIPKKNLNDYLEKEEYLKIENSFNYLTSLPIHSLTQEQIDALKNKKKEVSLKLKEISSKSARDILNDDLSMLKL